MEHRAGFVNIIGNTNAGKSTLLNLLVGEKLSAVTHKVQTTRHRIMGIVSNDHYQIVFSDTPGFLKPFYKLHHAMLSHIQTAIEDADLLLLVIAADDNFTKKHPVPDRIRELSTPVFAIINKIDKADEKTLNHLREMIADRLPEAKIFTISALYKINTDPLLPAIINQLPVHPPFFPADELTDKSERFLVSEIIREKIFLNYRDEIPYCCEVQINRFREENNMLHIHADIHVTKDSHKNIIIGKKGEAIKSTGIAARKDIEEMMGKKVYLELFVKVSDNWRENETALRRFGYLTDK